MLNIGMQMARSPNNQKYVIVGIGAFTSSVFMFNIFWDLSSNKTSRTPNSFLLLNSIKASVVFGGVLSASTVENFFSDFIKEYSNSVPQLFTISCLKLANPIFIVSMLVFSAISWVIAIWSTHFV